MLAGVATPDGPRVFGPVLAVAAATALLAAASCSDGDHEDATFVNDEPCVGFTPTGARLDDRELLDAAVAEWLAYDARDSPRGPALEDGAEVCVVYADVSEHGLPRVAMVSDDVGGTNPFVAVFEGMEEDDLDVAHIAGVGFLGDDAAAIGVGDGLWLLADGVTAATVHSGSPASAHEVDLSESRLVEGVVEGVLIAETAEAPVAVTSAGADADAYDRVAAVPVVDSPLAPTEVLESEHGAAALAAAVREARGDPQHRPPGLRLLGSVDVPDVGTALASAASYDRDAVGPVLSIGTPAEAVSVRVGPRYARDGREAVESVDPAAGWAAGTMIVDATAGPVAYVVAAQPPADVDGGVRLDVRVGRARHELPGPVAFAPAGGSAVAAVIGTAPSGVVVPTVPTEPTVTVDVGG